MLQVENRNSASSQLNMRRKHAIWKTMEQPVSPSNKEEPAKYEIITSASGFDPTECSPPNSFMENLKQRMTIYYK